MADGRLPTHFPCWVRAVYSYGGEGDRDLGFVEGDLIECLNAGDGQWWTGRLFRDKRSVGMFPCNFVDVLDDSFRPSTRSKSPMPSRSPSTSPYTNPHAPTSAKDKPFRKPFQAYAAPNLAATKRAELQKQESLSKSRIKSAVPSVHDNIQRVPSPLVHGYGSRAPSPAPPRQNSYASRAHSPAPPVRHPYGSRGPSPAPYSYDDAYESRPHSPAPPMHQTYGSRAPSPNPYAQYNHHSRPQSPELHFDIGNSPPPPAPPPHRHSYTPREAVDSYNHQTNGYHTPQKAPAPPSPQASGFTPSPLRSAMDDLANTLNGMGRTREPTPPEVPLDPWSPEAFDQTFVTAKKEAAPRPNTAMGLGGARRYDEPEEHHYGGSSQSRSRYAGQAPPVVLSNYVDRMEQRMNKLQANNPQYYPADDEGPTVPPKFSMERPQSSMSGSGEGGKLRHRKSAFSIGKSMGKGMLARTFTTKTNSTSSSSGAHSATTNTTSSSSSTDRSLMSGPGSSEFSYTSAGSMARKKEALSSRSQSAFGTRGTFPDNDLNLFDASGRPQTPLTGISYHSSHASVQPAPRAQSQAGYHVSDTGSMFGGLQTPKPKKSGFFKKIMESAKTGAASARSSIAAGESLKQYSPDKTPTGISSRALGGGSNYGSNAASDMGLGGTNASNDWVQVRRDINRSNSLSRIELVERKDRCQMMDYPVIGAVDELYDQCDGDEGADGQPVAEPIHFQSVNFSMVDKHAKFINSLPPMTNPSSLATGFICRPYRSDVQRLRAIFTWVSEKILWEEWFDCEPDTRRVLETKHGSPEEVAVFVSEMCAAVGVHAEVVRGYLKTPGEIPELTIIPRSNHWWNAVVVDGEWRFMDCSLASPSHPMRENYSSANGQSAEPWWFLARPSEICWTHVPESHRNQHLCPPVAHEILLALPCACPPFFKNTLQMADYDTSLIRIDDLELTHIKFNVPADIECVAEVEVKEFSRDAEGDLYETGDVVKKRALAQAEWFGGRKRYTVKALLPGDEGNGVLKIYAGKRGLMHSIKDVPHPLAFALPIIHTGENPPYEFLTRHPTPHAQRYDLYVAQPQCRRLALNNTFVFAVRQHPSSLDSAPPNAGGASPLPFRPSSAMSLNSSSASGSNSSNSTKPAKLAIQSPSGKVLRLSRKDERGYSTSQGIEQGDGTTWETIIKVGERGTWRGLVLADRSIRWCVFAEWDCV